MENESINSIEIGPSAWILRGYAVSQADQLLAAIEQVSEQAPFRHLQTRTGKQIGVEMTNCGELGWYSDRKSYRYETQDPQTKKDWPLMPDSIALLAKKCASVTGFSDFIPQACLINRYHPGVGMHLHQDNDEKTLAAPIISLSLGVSAVFMFGGMQRSDKPAFHLLRHGDVVVWGNEDRLRFHGIQQLKVSHHPLTGQIRYNLTIRQVYEPAN